MSALLKPRLTPAEYLAIERRAEFKSEFFDGEMFAMAGASRDHNRTKENFAVELGGRLKGGPCRTYTSDQRVKVEATGLYTYPDLFVVCGAETTDPADRDTLTNPKTIVEILSPSTKRYDRGLKFENYKRIPTLAEYVLVWQDQPRCERHARQADGSWSLAVFEGLGATLELTSVAVIIPLTDIYAGVEFAAAPEE